MLQGSVHVGALPLGRTQILPLAIAALLARHPRLHVATEREPVRRAGRLAAQRRHRLHPRRAAQRRGYAGPAAGTLFDDRISIIARAGHPLARSAARIDFDALRQATWVLSRHGSPSRELLERFSPRRARRRRCRRWRPATWRCCAACWWKATCSRPSRRTSCATRFATAAWRSSLCARPTQREIGLTQRLGALPSPGARGLMEEIRGLVASSADFQRRISARTRP